jgi:hypothetical protein
MPFLNKKCLNPEDVSAKVRRFAKNLKVRVTAGLPSWKNNNLLYLFAGIKVL